MKKLIVLIAFLMLTACGYKITKIDLTDPQIQELKKAYPHLESGYIVLKIKQPEKEEPKEEDVPNG